MVWRFSQIQKSIVYTSKQALEFLYGKLQATHGATSMCKMHRKAKHTVWMPDIITKDVRELRNCLLSEALPTYLENNMKLRNCQLSFHQSH